MYVRRKPIKYELEGWLSSLFVLNTRNDPLQVVLKTKEKCHAFLSSLLSSVNGSKF